MFEKIPLEMRLFNQWVVWRFEDTECLKPTKVPYSALNGKHADVNKPETWSNFDEAVSAAASGIYSGIGFVLTNNDPYTFIDLDDTKGNKEELDRQLSIFKEFESFAEISPSGNGLHIIIKGSIPSGRKRSNIEIYSDSRFMTMTGNTYRDLPILEYNDLLNVLYNQMGEGRNATAFYAGLEKAKISDEEVLEIATSAANAEKFTDLYYNGNWQKYYPSQSEADLALFDIIAFYSENGQQTQRLFLNSKLAEREKSRAQYRINYMLNKCFDRMLPPVDIDGLKNKLEEVLQARPKEVKKEIKDNPPKLDVYSIPPGLVGEIAQFVYQQAPRPVPEIALAGALGLMAGIVGRAYNVSGTGLNQYILLLAATGNGKEAIASGIDKLMGQILKTVPAAVEFIGPGEIASSQALLKYMAKGSNCFVSLVGEFGIYLQQMAAINAPPHLMGLRRMILDLYNKSGEGKVLRPSIYSEKEKNTSCVFSPAFTLLGESTPEKFYEGLHEGLISEGLLPRFSIIEYHGERPPFNQSHLLASPSFALIDRLSTVCAHALMLNSQNKAIQVKLTPEAKKLIDEFDVHCDLNINTSDKEVRRHLWNRAHIKVLKLAALIAVGCHPYEPMIDLDIATWALNMTLNDVRNLLKRFDSGEIGIDNDESKQMVKTIDTIKDYLTLPWRDVSKYAGDGMSNLHGNRIITYSYLQRRLASISIFRKDRIGASMSIKRSLKTLCERGDIQEVGRATLAKEYGTTAVCYMVCNHKSFGL